MSRDLDSFRFPSHPTNLVGYTQSDTSNQIQDSFPNNDTDYPLPSPSTYPIRRASFIDPNRLYSIDLSNTQVESEELSDLRRRYSMNPSKKQQPETIPTFTRRSSVLSAFLPNPSLNAATAPQVSEIPRLFEEVRQSIDIIHDEISRKKEKIVHHKKKHIEKAKKKAVVIEEHEMSIEKVCELYNTSFNVDNPLASYGLSKQVAAERLKINGPNTFTPPKREKFIWKVIDQFTTLFSLLMLFAGLLSFINVAIDRTPASYPNIFLGAILWFVVAMNATITLWQEHSSEKVIAAFLSLQTANCMVIREESMQRIDVSEVVIGDLIHIEPGFKVPADLRLLSVNGVKMDNSSLTGESEPQSRSVESSSHNPLESSNLAFFGTIVVEGSALGIVIRTGGQTVIGQIALLAQASPLKTPLRRQIDTFIRILGSMSLILAVLFFVVGIALGNPWFTCVLFSTGIIAANIPQGLIATMTLCLTVSAKRLSDINVLVKKLEHVETLGGVNVICSDKTGTLTQNRMTVVEQWCDGALSDVLYYDRMMKSKPNTNLPTFSNIGEENLSTAQKLIRCAALCSKTIFVGSGENSNKPILDRDCIGDASEIALVKFVETRTENAGLEDIRTAFPKVYEIPFNSKNKWMLTIHTCEGTCFESTMSLMLMKGAPERILEKCDSIFVNCQKILINDDLKQHFQDAYSFLASKGQRVLGLAQRYTSTDLVIKVKEKEETGTVKIGVDPTGGGVAISEESPQQIPLENFTFIGLVGLTDPPKIGVTEAISKCKHAGIQVVMVTGDHPTTAKAIAKQVGILEPNCKTRDEIAVEEGCVPEFIEYKRPDIDAIVLHGEQIDKLKDIEWKYILKKKQIVFSRTSPQQKLVIVGKFQDGENCVAVTGDGVNDSPALKKADIGIAMNISGSDVSKEAAAIILMDDNFASIVNGVEEGRLIFDNLKKSISYTLVHLSPELVPWILFIIIGIPPAITGLLVLCIDLGTELVAAISLSYETKESDIMTVPPRPKSELLVGMRVLSYSYLQVGVIETLAAFTSFFFALALYGVPPHYLYQSMPSGYFSLSTTKYLFIEETGIYLSPAAQWNILATAQTAYFLAIVVCQWFALFSTRTRRTSLLMQGMFTNLAIYVGIIFSVCIACIVIYVPFIGDYIFGTRYMIWLFWLLPIFYGILIILFDEYRKVLIRDLHFYHILW